MESLSRFIEKYKKIILILMVIIIVLLVIFNKKDKGKEEKIDIKNEIEANAPKVNQEMIEEEKMMEEYQITRSDR